ncbi:exonuclease domain-containing protein [Arthrobacter sp. NPDC092385]|uniref:exonuclease domain-containing protein n=1 Tax=Arthrobacter sp. NPDC092385 TaxID=3363943 RepID=UPI00382261BF
MQGLDFTAIDFETANSKRGSVCAVGLAKVRNGVVVDSASWLIKPPPSVSDFASMNIAVHGIRPGDVRTAPGWAESLQRILVFAGTDRFVAHNAPFDRSVLRGACAETGLAVPENSFSCSVDLARRLLGLEQNRLPDVARALGLGAFKHHDAGSDAEICAAAVVAIAQKHALHSLDLLWPAKKPTSSSGSHRYARTPTLAELPRANRQADPSNPLHHQVVVFTGNLTTMTREEAMDRVAALGATPANNVTKKTTMVVVGQEDASRRTVFLTPGSGKERKALQYIGAGQTIRAVSERELREWLGLDRPEDPIGETPADVLGTLESAVTGLLAWVGRRRVT